jgi:hypothetical protein
MSEFASPAAVIRAPCAVITKHNLRLCSEIQQALNRNDTSTVFE